MTKATYTAIRSILAPIDFEDKQAIMDALDVEINRGAAQKAAKAAEYDNAWEIVKGVFAQTTASLTATEIFEAAEEDFKALNFSKNKDSYGLTHNWADKVVKTEGKVNTYRLKA